MSLSLAPDGAVRAEGEDDNPPDRERRAWVPVTSMFVGVLAVMGLPLLREPRFYWWDDSLASFTGLWDRLAQAVLQGRLPWLELDMWRGGNFPGEAGPAMFNPFVIALAVVVHPLDDLALRMTLLKVALALVMAGGVYALARDYGAKAWPAAAAGVALCATGYTMYWDMQTWVNGLLISALVPWYWLTVRRLPRSPWMALAAAVMGYVLVTTGNPYGILALAAVVIAVGCEHLARGHRERLVALAIQAVIAMCWVALVYLPLLIASTVGYRRGGRIFNDEFFSPNLSTLLGSSTPLYTPYIGIFSGPLMREPTFYIAWFLLPLLPWIRWRRLQERWQSLIGLLVFGGGFLLLVLGPSEVWMFRWPGRLVTLLSLALLVGAAVALSAGIKDYSWGRFLVSVAILGFGFWMAFSDAPQGYRRLPIGTAFVILAFWLLVRWARSGTRLFLVIVAGTLGVVAMTSVFFPYNKDIAHYAVPSSVSAMRAGIGADTHGLTVVVAARLDAESGVTASNDLLIGSLYAVAGVESTSSYSGIGYTKADNDLCINYNGATCPELWSTLWATPPGEQASMADLLGAETVVVQRGFVDSPHAPPGWRLAKEDDHVLIFRREAPLTHPEGRVTVTSPGVVVSDNRMVGRIDETLSVTTGAAAGTITFSRLAWPGYDVTFNGKSLPLVDAPAGLLRVELPPNAAGTVDVVFTPPGVKIGFISVGVGVVLTVLEVLRQLRGRRRRDEFGATPAVTAQSAEPSTARVDSAR